MTLKTIGAVAVHRLTTCFFLGLIAFTGIMCSRAGAIEVVPYFKTFHDFSDHVGHYGVGLNLVTGNVTGLYLRTTGEVGNIFYKRTGLDYLLQGALGYNVTFAGVGASAICLYGSAGYQEVALYEGPRSAPEKAFYGGGIRYRDPMVELQAELHKFKEITGVRPRLEMVMPVDGTSDTSKALVSIFYEELFPKNNTVGFKLGYRF